jgi:hypothetical protein
MWFMLSASSAIAWAGVKVNKLLLRLRLPYYSALFLYLAGLINQPVHRLVGVIRRHIKLVVILAALRVIAPLEAGGALAVFGQTGHQRYKLFRVTSA